MSDLTIMVFMELMANQTFLPIVNRRYMIRQALA
uniref:Uncharacterized protein n=1 Tax=Siphoviridae sp. ct2vX3 TaxID=2825318 RepID=A0A8S5PXB8_9CAUD|nr:MAG TPA: hypothetical protein [Siphoviridae sp. ct2vX3]